MSTNTALATAQRLYQLGVQVGTMISQGYAATHEHVQALAEADALLLSLVEIEEPDPAELSVGDDTMSPYPTETDMLNAALEPVLRERRRGRPPKGAL